MYMIKTNITQYKSKYLIICAGINYKRANVFQSKYPDYKGIVYNAQEIKFNKQFSNKNQTVLVYGGGETASDMVMEAYYNSKKVIWCIPKGMWGFKRAYFNGEYAADMFTNSIDARNKYNTKRLTNEFISLVTGKSGTDIKTFDSKKLYARKFLNKSVEPIIKIHQGEIIAKKNIKKCINKIITFDNNEEYQVDIIIDCTGYKPNHIFNLDNGKLFKECISVNDPNLMYVGYGRPIVGSMMVICELQALLISHYLTKGFTKQFMLNDINKDKKHYDEFGLDTSRINVVDIQLYILEILELVGRKIPEFDKNLSEKNKLIILSSLLPTIINYGYDTEKCYNDYLKIKDKKTETENSTHFSSSIIKLCENNNFIFKFFQIIMRSLFINKNRRNEIFTHNYPYLSSVINAIVLTPMFSGFSLKNRTLSSIPHNYPWAKTLIYNYFNCPNIDGSVVTLLLFLMSTVLLSILKNFKQLSTQNNVHNIYKRSFVWTLLYNIVKMLKIDNYIKPILHVITYKTIINDNYESGALLLIYAIFYKLLNFNFNAVVLK